MKALFILKIKDLAKIDSSMVKKLIKTFFADKQREVILSLDADPEE